jgi:hypothetical protein
MTLRWIVQEADGRPRAIDDPEMKELIAQGLVTEATPLYELVPRAFSELPPELTSWQPPAPGRATPTHADDLAGRGPEHAERAAFDRPFEDDEEDDDLAELDEEVPRSRLPRIAVAATLLIAAGAASYFAVRPGARRAAAASRAAPPPTVPVAATAPPVIVPPPPASVAPPPAARPPLPAHAIAPPDPGAEQEPSLPDPPPPRPPTASYARLVAKANRLLEDGEDRPAQALFEKALADQPGGPDALIGLAYVHLGRGANRKAVALFNQVLAADGGYAPALLGLGEAYREQGMRAAAVDAFKKFLALKPTGPDAETARSALKDLAGR